MIAYTAATATFWLVLAILAPVFAWVRWRIRVSRETRWVKNRQLRKEVQRCYSRDFWDG